jgi:hypothetical protein
MSLTMDSRASHQPDYSWTTGGKENLVHRRVIDRGGYGDVHEVPPLCEVFIDIRSVKRIQPKYSEIFTGCSL